MTKKLLFSLTIVIFTLLSSVGHAHIYTFYPCEDTWVNQNNANAQYGNNSYLTLRDRSGLSEVYVKFSNNDLSMLKDQKITSAVFYLYQYQGTYSPGDTIGLHKVTSDWDENTLSWNSRPGYESQAAGSLYIDNGIDIWRRWDNMENMVKSWLYGPNYGLILENSLDNTNNELYARFRSSEYDSEQMRPYLQINADPEPLRSAVPETEAIGYISMSTVILWLFFHNIKRNHFNLINRTRTNI